MFVGGAGFVKAVESVAGPAGSKFLVAKATSCVRSVVQSGAPAPVNSES